MPQQPLPNWYPDPDDPTGMRFWDGQQWTDQRAPFPSSGRWQANPLPSSRFPFEAIGVVYRRYFNFSGRASRTEYWWFLGFFFATYFALLFTEHDEGRDAFVEGLNRSRATIIQTQRKLPDTPDVECAYDVVLLDCSPSLGVLTLNALTAADDLIIPLQCEMLSHRGVGQLLDTVHDVQRILNPGLRVLGVLPTMFDGRTNHARAVLADVSGRYGLDVLEPPIPKSIRFAEAPAAGRSVLATARRTPGAEAYRALAAGMFG